MGLIDRLYEAVYCRRDIEGNVGAQFVEPTNTPGALLALDPVTGQPVPTQGLWLRNGITQTAFSHSNYSQAPPFWNLEIVTYGRQTVSAAVAKQATIPWNSLVIPNNFRSSMHAKIVADIGGEQIRFDAAFGGRYAFTSPAVTVMLEVPQPAVPIAQGGTDATLTNGVAGVGAGVLLGNVAVEARLTAGTSPIGRREAQYTEVVTAVAGNANAIAIPNRARRVRFFQTSASPAPAGAMNFTSGEFAVGVGFDRGRIDFPAGSFSTDLLEIPGFAQFVSLGNVARTVIAVWLLEL